MGVNKVDTASGNVFMDISDSTVTPETLAEGTTAYNSKGEKIVGTMRTDCNVVFIDCALDLTTMSVVSVSHTYDEIIEILQNGKMIFMKADYGIGVAYAPLTSNYTIGSQLFFQIMTQNNFGDGMKLYYFAVRITSYDEPILMPYIVNTTSMGG